MTAKEIKQAEIILSSQVQALEGIDLERDVAFYQKAELTKMHQNLYTELVGMIHFVQKMGYECIYHPRESKDSFSHFTIEKSILNYN